MQLSTRTGLAAMGAALLAVALVATVVVVLFEGALYERVDRQLEERAESASVLVAVGDRVSTSELNPTIDGARIVTDAGMTPVGRLPDSPLPPSTEPGFRTESADGEQWRILTVVVDDVPRVGDRAVVDLVAPLGDVDAQALQLRQRTVRTGLLVALLTGGVGWLLGRRVVRPLTRLQADAAGIGVGSPETWSVEAEYGTAEVDEVAGALNTSLQRLGQETRQREAALDSARSFAAAASHELRTPLQGAMTQLDLVLAGSDGSGGAVNDQPVREARRQLDRMASSLSAVRALTEVELIGPERFETTDLAEVADQAVASLSPAEARSAEVVFAGDEVALCRLWVDGARVAIANVVRNAVRHGAPANGTDHEVVVTVVAATRTVWVDDAGPGIGVADRARVVLPFERNSTTVAGSGLGLAFARRVAEIHGGSLVIGESPDRGSRVTLRFG